MRTQPPTIEGKLSVPQEVGYWAMRNLKLGFEQFSAQTSRPGYWCCSNLSKGRGELIYRTCFIVLQLLDRKYIPLHFSPHAASLLFSRRCLNYIRAIESTPRWSGMYRSTMQCHYNRQGCLRDICNTPQHFCCIKRKRLIIQNGITV